MSKLKPLGILREEATAIHDDEALSETLQSSRSLKKY